MNEADLKRALMPQLKAAMPGAVCWRVEDKFTKGRPDIFIIWRGRCAGVEVKMDRAERKGKRDPLQELTLRRLELAGAYAYWLVYWPDGAVLERWDTSPVWSIQKPTPGAPHREIARALANLMDSTL
jgi:hypothetical protein